MQKPTSGPEIFFGLVGAVGCQLDGIVDHLKSHLIPLGYELHEIKVIELLQKIPEYGEIFEIPDKGKAYEAKMSLGNDFRKKLGSGYALALLSIIQIRRLRDEYNSKRNLPENQPIPFRAYVFNSLKRKEEVERFREVYGDSFHLIGAYSRVDQRETDLKLKIGNSLEDDREVEETVQHLMRRDLRESDQPWGQNVYDTYPESDIFVDVTAPKRAEGPIRKYIELLFGHQFHTPTREEYGMYNAFGASLRSADLARQVGAYIATIDGQVLAMGTNDVPSPKGGLYWSDDEHDKRDFHRTEDESNVMRRKLFANIVRILKDRGFITPDTGKRLLEHDVLEALKDGRLTWVTEYGRSVHAEMAAITDAARRGISIDKSVLYTSTFPCHNCAKHIVASGIRRVVYVHPYPKSQVAEMYNDSITIDLPDPENGKVLFKSFVGIAPRRYDALYTMKRKRKTDEGKVLNWGDTPETVAIRMEYSPMLYLKNEKLAVEEFEELQTPAPGHPC